eukprot:TRINITY_DN17352_c0_g1_i1.p1 TRINITY_DN17352_c0_g1~~TRINITY_DN17352_c0_g1_i1.p1  ORF type:complete len:280 (+),score=23.96 TRINITY_DN17352_c0_g1_i1:36-842(+)
MGCLCVFLWKRRRQGKITAFIPTSGVYITYEGVIRVVPLDGLQTGRDFKRRTNQLLQLNSSYEDLVVIKNWDQMDNTDERAILDSNESLERYLTPETIKRSLEFPLVVDRKSFNMNAFPWLYPVMYENKAPQAPEGNWCFGIVEGQRVMRKNDPSGNTFGQVIERSAQGVIAVCWDDGTTTWENWGWQGRFDVIPANPLPPPYKPAILPNQQRFTASRPLPYSAPSTQSDFSSAIPTQPKDNFETFSTTITSVDTSKGTPIVQGRIAE